MIREHGVFNLPPSSGEWENEEGVKWNIYVLNRVDYGPRGELLALYEDDTKEVAIEIGSRLFAEVRNGVIDWASANPSTLNPHTNALVVETTEPITAGMLYRDGAFSPAPPPPYVPITLPADVLYGERMTDEEFDALDANVRSTEGARIYRSFVAVQTFTEGTDMWTLLVKNLDAIGTTSERRAQLLARP